jgi:hypothetical protein
LNSRIGALDAIHRLPKNAHYWLAEDVVYIITPEERCAFLYLNTDEERAHFIERFWYRHTVNPVSLDYDFKAEHEVPRPGPNGIFGALGCSAPAVEGVPV